MDEIIYGLGIHVKRGKKRGGDGVDENKGIKKTEM